MNTRQYLLEILDDTTEALAPYADPCGAILTITDTEREEYRSWKAHFEAAKKALPTLESLKIADLSPSLRWLSEIELDGGRDTPSMAVGPLFHRLVNELIIELTGTPIENIKAVDLVVDVVTAEVMGDGVEWSCYLDGNPLKIAATLTWEELLGDKPIEPH